MSNQEVLIRYNIDEIFACRESNCLMTKELEEYCANKYKGIKTILSDLIKPMDDITKSHSHGINPNDITLKNMIRDYCNKVNHNNYDSVFEDLKSLNYTCENHFGLLATELILKSMNDAMACKGVESNKSQKTPSEIYMSIAYEFSGFFIKQHEELVKFKSVLTKECQHYFKEFTDKNASMDQNNPHRVSNYKGFMNMIGLMYCYNLFPKEIICACFNKIVKLILEAGLPQEECDNYYSGYERLMNRVLSNFEKDSIQKFMIDEFNGIKTYINEINQRINATCLDEPGAKKRRNSDKPIRMFSIMVHKQNITRFEKLCDQYAEAERKYNEKKAEFESNRSSNGDNDSDEEAVKSSK